MALAVADGRRNGGRRPGGEHAALGEETTRRRATVAEGGVGEREEQERGRRGRHYEFWDLR